MNRPVINLDECKGCGRCITACPKKLLEMSTELNARGVCHIRYKGEGCIGCGLCFYTCPEPYAIKIEKE